MMKICRNIHLTRHLPTELREPRRVMLIFWRLSLVFGCLTTGGGASSDCSGVISDCGPNSQDDQVCRGSLVLTSPENQRETFPYDKSGLSCEPENLEHKFPFSTAEVNGCGEFTIHSKRNGRGNAATVSGSSGPVSVRDMAVYSKLV